MEHKFASLATFMLALTKRPEEWLRFTLSPGGAASRLGVSRQRVHQLCELGALNVVRTGDGYVLLDPDEVEMWRKTRLTALRKAGKLAA